MLLFDIRQHLATDPDQKYPSLTRLLLANLHSPEEKPVVVSLASAKIAGLSLRMRCESPGSRLLRGFFLPMLNLSVLWRVLRYFCVVIMCSEM